MLKIVIVIALALPTVGSPELPSASVHQGSGDVRQPDDPDQPDQPAQPISVTVQTQKSAEELQAEREDREKDRAIQADMARFNLQLVWVGIASILLSFVGILVAAYAAKAARQAAIASERSATAADHGVGVMREQAKILSQQTTILAQQARLAEIMNQQWLDVGNWRARLEGFPTDKDRHLTVECTVTNNSGRTVHLDRVDWHVQHDDKTGTDYWVSDISYAPLVPKAEFQVRAYSHLGDIEKAKLLTTGFRVAVMGYAVFIDNTGAWQRQPFGQFCSFKEGEEPRLWPMKMFLMDCLEIAEKRFVDDQRARGIRDDEFGANWGTKGHRWDDDHTKAREARNKAQGKKRDEPQSDATFPRQPDKPGPRD
jgi:hypothetical protein